MKQMEYNVKSNTLGELSTSKQAKDNSRDKKQGIILFLKDYVKHDLIRLCR